MTDQVDSRGRIRAQQQLRLKRLSMSFGSYAVTFSLVCFCVWAGLIPVPVLLAYLAMILVINSAFLFLTLSDINLRFRDPSMTMAQILLSFPPPLFVMFFIEEGQGRAIFMLISVIPILYGMLALNTRQYIGVAVGAVAQYGVLIAALWWWRPDIMATSLEIFQALALILVMAEVAMIGGYISGLREQLRRRNDELNNALEQLNEMARRDALTGLFNRRHLMEALDQEMNRCNRTGGPFSVCIFDIDHFKQINDTYGHQAGDLVLTRVAEFVTHNLRNIDCFGRFGGEEFLLILPQTDMDGALIKAERLREQLAEVSFSEIDENLRVTTSVGLTQHRNGESADDTLARADEALYTAKASGRNQSAARPAPGSIKGSETA